MLRLYSGEEGTAKAEHEFLSIISLQRNGHPVPRVYVLESDHSPFGNPFIIMGKVEGEVMWAQLLDSPEEKQKKLLD